MPSSCITAAISSPPSSSRSSAPSGIDRRAGGCCANRRISVRRLIPCVGSERNPLRPVRRPGDADVPWRCAMKAMTYRGPYKVRVEQKPDPVIEHPNDAIVRVELAAICGSDLHLYHGMMPDTRVGHTFGHEFIGTSSRWADRCRTSRSATGSWCPSTSTAAHASSARADSSRTATTSTPMRPRSAASTATRTHAAATTAGRPSSFACRSPTWGRRSSQTTSRRRTLSC